MTKATFTTTIDILREYAKIYAPANAEAHLLYLAEEITHAHEHGEAAECPNCIRENAGLPVAGDCTGD